MVAPALTQIKTDLMINSDARTQLVLSIFVLAYIAGFFFWAPLSEVYGRRYILHIATSWFTVWNVVCGFALNEAMISAGRLLSGVGAAASLTLGGAIVGEIWLPAQRGQSLACLTIFSLLGPCVGPILGGAIAEHSIESWRWAFWTTAIFNILLQVLAAFCLWESHVPTILRRLDHSSTDSTPVDKIASARPVAKKVLLTCFKRPFHLASTQIAIQGLAVWSGLSFGSLYILLSVVPMAFTEVHHQSLTVASLNYISYGVGTILASQLSGAVIDAIWANKIKHANRRTSGAFEESTRYESRLYPCVPAICLMMVGLLIFGWTLNFNSHWISSNIGLFLFGIGSTFTTQCTTAYVTDIFSSIRARADKEDADTASVTPPSDCIEESQMRVEAQVRREGRQKLEKKINWTASAMASIWAAKALCGFLFPLFAVHMIHSLGWGWSCTLLALLNFIVGMSVAISLLVWGERLRARGRENLGKEITNGQT